MKHFSSNMQGLLKEHTTKNVNREKKSESKLITALKR